MKPGLTYILLIINILALPCRGQTHLHSGFIIDEMSGDSLIGAHLLNTSGQLRAITDLHGIYTFSDSSETVDLTIQYLGFESKTFESIANQKATIYLTPSVESLRSVVIGASRYEEKLEHTTVSLDVVPSQLIHAKNAVDVRDVLDQVPGVQINEDQISIRGGSGFAYGVGSRTLVVVDNMPMLNGSAAQPKWDLYPTENVDQIEVIKGASSAVYGSSALNGVVNIQTAKPGIEPETRIRVFKGIYHDPVRRDTLGSRLDKNGEVNKTLKWWTGPAPSYNGYDFVHLRKYKRLDIVASGAGMTNPGYRQGEDLDRYRFNLKVNRLDPRIKGLQYDLGGSLLHSKGNYFLLWEDQNNAYKPFGGLYPPSSSLNGYNNLQYNFDQRTLYMPNDSYKHLLQHRVLVTQQRVTNIENSASVLVFDEYQFTRNWSKSKLLAGTSNAWTQVLGGLFGAHTSNNWSLYGQYQYEGKKLRWNIGLRTEHFMLDGAVQKNSLHYPLGMQFTDSTTTWKDTLTLSNNSAIRPLARFGLNYELAKHHFIRASFGQGYRFPSISEKFVQTAVGAVKIFANPDLVPESGWNAELGWRYRLESKRLNGYIDVAAFWTEYNQMMEFVFGQYYPDSLTTLTLDDLVKYSGFQSQNASQARINGFELSTRLIYFWRKQTFIFTGGYTYLNPVIIGANDTYKATLSDPTSPLLKYRYQHQFKGDLTCKSDRWHAGMSVRYEGFQHNIDRTFVEPVLGSVYILPGLKKYRQTYYKGAWIFDARIGYEVHKYASISLIVNNLLNKEYMGRPGDMQPPRTTDLQLILTF